MARQKAARKLVSPMKRSKKARFKNKKSGAAKHEEPNTLRKVNQPTNQPINQLKSERCVELVSSLAPYLPYLLAYLSTYPTYLAVSKRALSAGVAASGAATLAARGAAARGERDAPDQLVVGVR